jgi:ethanolamine utilization microcompartment shell protein EutS
MVDPPVAVIVASNVNVFVPGWMVALLHVIVPPAREHEGEQVPVPLKEVPAGIGSFTSAVNAAPGLLTCTVYVIVSPFPALPVDASFTTCGFTSSVFVTTLLVAGVVTSVEVTLALFETV